MKKICYIFVTVLTIMSMLATSVFAQVDGDLDMSEDVVKPQYTISVDTVGSGAATVSSETAYSGSTVTLTATPYTNAEFIGWYLDDALCSTGKTYTVTVSKDACYTAKFTRENLLADKNTADYWSSNSHTTFANSTLSCYGGSAVQFTTMVGYQAQYYCLALKPNTDYQLQLSIKSGKGLSRLAILNNTATFLDASGGGAASNYIDALHLMAFADSDIDVSGWTDYVLSFTTNESTNETDTYYLYLQFSGTTYSSSVGNTAYISDLSLMDMTVNYENEYDAHFRDSSNWAAGSSTYDANHSTQVKGYSGFQNCSWATATTSFAYTNNDKGLPSVAVAAKYQMPHVFLPTLQANTDYTISFSYMTVDTSNTSCPIQMVGLFAPTVENARFDGFALDGDNGFLGLYGSNYAYSSANGIYAENVALSTENHITGATRGTWYTVSFSFHSGDLTDLALVFLFAGSSPVYFDNFTITEYPTTAYNKAAALRKAGKGTNITKNGMRIYNRISKKYIEDNNIVEFGGLARNTQQLSGAELTLENLGTISPGVAYENSQPVAIWQETDDAYIYTIYLTGISSKNFGADYTMRTYAKDANGNVYYGGEVNLAVFDVAWSIDQGYSENGTEQTENDILAFEAFAKGNDNYAKYTDWLVENSKRGGELSGVKGASFVTVNAENGYAYSSGDQNGGSVLTDSAVKFVSSPKVNGASFLGWYNGDTLVSSEPSFTYTVTEDITLTAKYDNTSAPADTTDEAGIKTAIETNGYYEPYFKKTIINTGNNARLKAVYNKLLAGEDITVVGFGGSITQGAGTSSGNSYGQLVCNMLDEMGSGTVTYINKGIGATTSVYGVGRMGKAVIDSQPDLVLLDFTINDQFVADYAYSYEALVRELAENEIATIAIMFGQRQYYTTNGIKKERNLRDMHLPSLIYYGIPTIDYYHPLWDYLDSNGDEVNTSADILQWGSDQTGLWSDYIHPNTNGHRLAANAIVYYIENIAANSTDIAEQLPTELFYAKSNYYVGSVSYQSDGDLAITGEGYKSITATTADPNGGTASANWKPWQINKGGYIEFTVSKAKSLSLIRANSVSQRSANIYVNGVLLKTDTPQNSGYTDNDPLPWVSQLFYFDGTKDVTFRIECTSDTPYIIHNLQFAIGEQQNYIFYLSLIWRRLKCLKLA